MQGTFGRGIYDGRLWSFMGKFRRNGKTSGWMTFARLRYLRSAGHGAVTQSSRWTTAELCAGEGTGSLERIGRPDAVPKVTDEPQLDLADAAATFFPVSLEVGARFAA